MFGTNPSPFAQLALFLDPGAALSKQDLHRDKILQLTSVYGVLFALLLFIIKTHVFITMHIARH